MKLRLSENIRTLRKEKRMTQENLAEALGVTVGAVYKWESGLSQPELNLIVELADFFDTSVDALLGCRMNDNRLESVLDRMGEYCKRLDPEVLPQAEKILAKYPHSLRAVYGCAEAYLVFGAGTKDRALLGRARELLEQARLLTGQSDDKSITEMKICGATASALFMMGEYEKSLELLKNNNEDGVFSSQIGVCLAMYLGRTKEAGPYLSRALLHVMSDLFDTIVGYVFVYLARKDWESALAAVKWGLAFLDGVKTEDKPSALEKIRVEMLALLGAVQAEAGFGTEADAAFREAAALAEKFDSAPDYSLKTLRFGENMEQNVIFDAFGASANGSVTNLLKLLKNDALSAKWEETIQNGKEN
ncbi:MAG: helix-turn-helix transcriptional regulator [Clostridia bacterium]|nr:helix-turn-helix transcriptional regulator [Clostridia bacterium]